MKKAVYAGSFDPPTNGHLWMIEQSSSLFDEVVVLLGINPEKKSKYTEEERIFMLQSMTKQYDNVTIKSLGNHFLVDFARKLEAKYIVRGIRSISDYDFERTMRYINSDLYPEVTTIFLLPPREFIEVSSTMVNGMIGFHDWENMIKNYIPPNVYQFILEKYKDLRKK